MAESKQYASSPIATLLGDVVDSRHHPDRRQLHQRIQAALETAADSALDRPSVTVGDEFQGSYPSVGQAIDAALTLRLALAPAIDVRFGIGWGPVSVLEPGSGIQDGPGWWAAREAIEATVERHARARGQRSLGAKSAPRSARAGSSGPPSTRHDSARRWACESSTAKRSCRPRRRCVASASWVPSRQSSGLDRP